MSGHYSGTVNNYETLCLDILLFLFTYPERRKTECRLFRFHSLYYCSSTLRSYSKKVAGHQFTPCYFNPFQKKRILVGFKLKIVPDMDGRYNEPHIQSQLLS